MRSAGTLRVVALALDPQQQPLPRRQRARLGDPLPERGTGPTTSCDVSTTRIVVSALSPAVTSSASRQQAVLHEEDGEALDGQDASGSRLRERRAEAYHERPYAVTAAACSARRSTAAKKPSPPSRSGACARTGRRRRARPRRAAAQARSPDARPGTASRRPSFSSGSRRAGRVDERAARARPGGASASSSAPLALARGAARSPAATPPADVRVAAERAEAAAGRVEQDGVEGRARTAAAARRRPARARSAAPQRADERGQRAQPRGRDLAGDDDVRRAAEVGQQRRLAARARRRRRGRGPARGGEVGDELRALVLHVDDALARRAPCGAPAGDSPGAGHGSGRERRARPPRRARARVGARAG